MAMCNNDDITAALAFFMPLSMVFLDLCTAAVS